MATQSEDRKANEPTADGTVEGSLGGTIDGSIDRKDSFDEILVRIVRDPRGASADAELMPGTELASRFQIVRLLGAGGMGTVYVARDRSLDRDVAIKLHHQAGGAARLRREAVAMARLAHPNVVTVFEVGELDRRPFVVMEYIAGTTLRAWLGDAPRSVREILAHVVAAGEGLAAAHAAGLVHRDFKPENVLIGSDGRARVGDFGLARELISTDSGDPGDPGDPEPASSAQLSPMTQTGAVLGTPAYMAPEQFAGAPVDARADQFAYCVTVWEALWGQRPFAGATAAQLQQAITTGTRAAPAATPQVSTRVRAAIERGLAPDPKDRFPSMQALLAELRPPAHRRTRWIVAASASVALGAAAVAWSMHGSNGREMCGRAGESAITAWDPARRLAVSQAFARSGRPHADATFARVAEQIDRRTHDWIEARVGACEATHVRGEQSPAALDLRMRCLDRKLDELRAVIDVIVGGDASVVDHAVEAVAKLGPIAECADTAALAGAVPLPVDPAVRASIAAFDNRLTAITARRVAGQYQATLPLAEALDRDAASLDYAPLRARIASARARLLEDLGRGGPAEAAWFAALQHASAAHDERLVFDAWRALLDVRMGMTSLVGTDVLVQAATASAVRLERDDPRHALLDQSLGGLHVLDNKFAEAERHATAARDWFVSHAPGTLEEAEAQRTLSSAQLERGDLQGSLTSNGRALAIFTQILGADHPQVARLHESRSIVLTQMSRFDEALAELTDVIGSIERAYGTDSLPRGKLAFAIGEIQRKHGNYPAATAAYRQALAIYQHAGDEVETARALVGIGITASELGQLEVARTSYEEARAVAERALPASERLLAIILQYHSSTLQGDELPQAERELNRALEIRARIYGPDSVSVAQTENSLGAHYTEIGAHDQAVAHLRRALEIEERALGPDAYDVLIAHHNLGNELFIQDHFADALAEHERVLAGLERILGHDHPTLAAPLAMLTYEYAERGRAADGLASGERAYAILAKAHQATNPDLDLCYGNALWVAGKDRARAVALVRKAAVDLRASHDDPFMLTRAEAWLKTHR